MSDIAIEYEKAFKSAHAFLEQLEDLIDAAYSIVDNTANNLREAEYKFFSYTGHDNMESELLWKTVKVCRSAFNSAKKRERCIERLYGRVLGTASLIDADLRSLSNTFISKNIQKHIIPELSDIVMEYL